ncbi:tyrosine-type recombinase/integrase [Rhizobium sullae]|uniref:Tyrosine-type recombinase/integrase n=1 Tax=Rhizobium sullae TaxID=50338 RepID=A0ABY5XXY2_RHISU|nr:tyrosine-type recombinase/integrase [Rhizobium sullae]UWU19360.1 tyrosine-type recombinase/integrase [Rhizobium sullae]
MTPSTRELPGVDLHEVQIGAFQTWLRRHRGYPSAPSVATVVWSWLLADLGPDPKLYDARLVRQVILDEAQRSSRANLKTMTMALRGYLKYLATQGLCQPGLDQAIPTVPQWRLSALPLYISTADVDRVVASCDVTTPMGIRDHAVLLLLARLGLRAGDVSSMCLEDIDWREGTLCVRAKGRHEIRLPLSQDAGFGNSRTGVPLNPGQRFH